MNGRTSTLLGKLASDQVSHRPCELNYKAVKRKLKRSWNATPRNRRAAMRQEIKEVLA